MEIRIAVGSRDPAVSFAAAELARYLAQATKTPAKMTFGASGSALFTVRLATEAELPAGQGRERDWLLIRPQGKGYLLAGANPRSVVFAVYRYLQELGFRWVRPGPTGEYVPALSSALPPGPVEIAEGAAYRFRTICIEGACSVEHVVNLIDWSAKNLMNGYFIQFEHGTCFWKRWYTHGDNPLWKPEPFTAQVAEGCSAGVIAELKRRGMYFERMGHGWTGRTVGLASEGWENEELKLPEELQGWLAQTDGKRQFWRGQPLNTNLCYSNPAVRAKLVQTITTYARQHREVDVLHLWLADGSNNHCECAECQQATAADWYVTILNELDAALTAAKLPTRVVFLIYVDLLWPPQQQRIKNPGRFILMFAPITRSFQHSFAGAEVPTTPLPPYVRNKLQFPKNVGENIAFLRGWQEQFQGESFDFDYHLIWACHYDLNHFTIARVLHGDVQHLGELGLHGFNSCQVQRLGFPHNLAITVLARTLWDKRLTFDEIARDYFAAAYGDGGAAVQAFFCELSALWAPFFEAVHMPKPDEPRIQQGLANLKRMRKLMAGIAPVAKARAKAREPALRKSWKDLELYLELLSLQVPAMEGYLKRTKDAAARFEKMFAWLREHEGEIHEGLDIGMYLGVSKWRLHELKQAAGEAPL